MVTSPGYRAGMVVALLLAVIGAWAADPNPGVGPDPLDVSPDTLTNIGNRPAVSPAVTTVVSGTDRPVLANDAVTLTLSSHRGSIYTFALNDVHPLALPEWSPPTILPDRWEEIQSAPLDETPLAVLGLFNVTGANHNVPFNGGLAPGMNDWRLVESSPSVAVYEARNPRNGLRYELRYEMAAGDAPTVSVRYRILNPTDEDRLFEIGLRALNGIHQDVAAQDRYFNYWFVQPDDEGMDYATFQHLTPDTSQNDPRFTSNNGQMLFIQQTGDTIYEGSQHDLAFLGQRTRFFSAFLTPRAFRRGMIGVGDAPPPALTNDAAEPEPVDNPAVIDVEGSSGLDTGSVMPPTAIGTGPDHLLSVVPHYYLAGDPRGGDANVLGTACDLRLRWTNPEGGALTLPAGEEIVIHYDITISSLKSEHLERLPDERMGGILYFEWFYRFFRILVDLLAFVLWLLHFILPNYGLAIIALVFLIKAALHRTNYRAQRSMIKMQTLAPELKKLQEQYKNDQQQLAAKQFELWKKHGVNPVSGCLPIFLQMPIFIALYTTFRHYAEFRGVSFLWIHDLTLPDQLLNLGFFIPIPTFSGIWWVLATLNVLPILYIGAAIYNSLMMPVPQNADPQQQQMQKMMRWMPVLFGVIFYNMPAGLVLYFSMQAILSGIEMRYIRQSLEADGEKV